jgi:hypothetical protein
LPPAESPTRRNPIVVETVIDEPVRLVTPTREPLSPSPREHVSSPAREPFAPSPRETHVHWERPSVAASRQQREITQEPVLTQAAPAPALRRSSRNTKGQAPNRLIKDRADAINLGKGHSRLNPSSFLVNNDDPARTMKELAAANNDDHMRTMKGVAAKAARDAIPETKVAKEQLRHLYRTSIALNQPKCV